MEELTTFQKLLGFITREFGQGRTLTGDELLMPDIVDSLGVFVLSEYIQHEFGVVLDDNDLTAENLRTTQSLTVLVIEMMGRTG